MILKMSFSSSSSIANYCHNEFFVYFEDGIENVVSTRPKIKLNVQHREHLICFFDDNKRVTIEDAVEYLTEIFQGLQIKKSIVAEFMKDECNLTVKRISRHLFARNSEAQLEERAI